MLYINLAVRRKDKGRASGVQKDARNLARRVSLAIGYPLVLVSRSRSRALKPIEDDFQLLMPASGRHPAGNPGPSKLGELGHQPSSLANVDPPQALEMVRVRMRATA